MKKRILAMLLALVLVFSLVPSVAIAEGEEHIHCLCGATVTKGATCADCGSEAVEWTGTNELPSTTGNYYLTESISDEKAVINGQHVALCLHGQTVTSTTGIKLAYVAGGGSLTLTDCAATPGKLTGVTKEVTIQVANNGTFNMYGGKITGNNAPTVEGTIRLEQGSATSATFNMYGGEISGNTSKRGTIYTVLVNASYKSQIVRLLGGKITGNHAAGTSASAGGGAGVLAMCPIEVGGNVQIHSNTAAAGVADVYIRNDQKGAVIISADKPLEADAKLNIGMYHTTADLTDIAEISGNPTTWDAQWLTLDGEPVNFLNGKFFVGEPPVVEEPSEPEAPTDHIHCLCGAETTEGKTCASCGSKAVLWSESTSIPTESGYYYLADHVSTGAVIPAANADVAICLHGKNITSAAGKKIWYLASGVKLTVTDCATEQGSITGCVNDYVVQAMVGTTFNLYGGKITGNTTSGDGCINLGQGNTSTNGATFNMHGGEISGNTVKRGTIMTNVATGSNKMPIVRILGGIITGNHATGTTASNGNCGGAGIVAMCPIEVGGDAKIYGNTAAAGPADIYLRNDQKGALVISSDVPLCDGAQISYGVHVEEADPTDLQAITGTPDAAAWKNTWVSFNGQKVGFDGEHFFVDDSVEGHIHCLCGKQTVAGETCAACNSKAVVWSATGTMPAESGYYYLTGPVSANAQFLNDQNINLCLHGQTVTSAAGKKFLYLNKNTNYNITDCTAAVVDGQYQAGCFTGTTGVDLNGSTFRVNAGCTLGIYAGKFTGNKANDSGIFYVDASSSATTPGGIFTMYGGEISGNICQRGTIYGVSTGVNKPAIRIYGGVITGNSALGIGSQVGGGGIFAFTPVEVGGDAKIYGNTAAVGGADIYVRNDGSYTGRLVISEDVPLTGDAKICYSLYVAENNYDQLQFITGTPDAATWNLDWVSYDGQKVGYDGTNFFLDKASVQGHIHCLCGAQTLFEEICSACGSKAVMWKETAVMPTASGYYYLTGDVTAKAQFLNAGEQISLCLHGKTVTSAEGKRFLYLNKDVVYNVTDCSATGEGESYSAGKLTGTTGVDTYGSTIRINAGCELNWYAGILSGNKANDSGIVYVDKSDKADVPAGVFNMYGGLITDNTSQRGTVYGVSGGTNTPVIRILGGVITGNSALGTGTQVGGAGIFAFSPVEVGGDAKIYGNTATLGGADIYLRNDGDFTGALVISGEMPLKAGANIQYSLYVQETDIANLQFITGAPDAAAWDSSWVNYDGQKVSYDGAKFYIDKSSLQGHIHCLCGAQTLFDEICSACGSKAVMWKETGAMPTASGHYYLSGDVSTGAVVPGADANVAICLHGHTITSAAGKKIWYLTKGAAVTVTDCAENQGSITGCQNEPAVQVDKGSSFSLYGGKITGITTTGEGIVLLAKGNATTPGGAFYMYGGEISGNTCKRGTVMMNNAIDDNMSAVVRILGGTITGNHATGTSLNDGGGAGILAMGPVEIGGDAKIYGNTSVAGPADIYLRNDQKGKLIVSSEKPLCDGAKINCDLRVSEADLADLQYVTGTPTHWNPAWVTYCGEALRYEDGKFTIAKPIVWSNHQHDGKQWISVTEQTGLLPEYTGYYVLDEDMTLPREMQINANQEVVLCLNGHTLKAAEGARHFTVLSGGKLTICDCTEKTENGVYTAGALTGADNKQYGASIRVRPGAECNLYGGKITGNHTTLEGGAFYLVACSGSDKEPAVLNMYGGEISYNSADKGYGGAIRFAGAQAGYSAATFHMEGGTICNNESPNYGGAFHVPGYATVELLGGVIENNTTVAGGGAVSINGLTTLVVNGTVIRGNSAGKWGGGIYAKAGATVEMQGGEVSGNAAKAGAGILIEGEGTTLNMSGGKVTKNKVTSANGGGLYAAAKTVMNISGGEVCGNTSESGGAGVVVVTATCNMTGGKICHNESESWGAGMLLSTNAIFNMSGGSVNDNYTPKSAAGIYSVRSTIHLNGGSVSGNVAQLESGGIRLEGSTLNINGGSVSGNRTVEGNGGGIFARNTSYKKDGVKITVPSHVVMYSGSISNNYSAKAGSGILIQNQGTTFTMYGGTVSHNTAYKFAGAVYAGTGSNFSMHGGSICYNTMETDGVAGVYHDGGNGNHTGGQIYGNSTPVSGGGFGVSRDGTEVYAKGLKIYDNSAKAAAGVLLSNKGKLYMEDCEVYNNKASYLGGGIYQYTYVDLIAKNCVIRDNVAAQDGGGFWSWAISNATFENCVFENNKAEKGQGGAVWTRGDTLTMIGCTVKNNTAPGNGGGLYFGAMGAATDGWTDGFYFENTTISDNVSGGIGGGLFFGNGSHGELVDMTITGNKAAAEGGAFWARETVELHGTTTITGNHSGGEGYAVYLADSNYDGHSYFNGKFKMSGDLRIVDNNGGDLYLGEKVPVIFSGDGLGQNAKIHVNMYSGLLTQWVWGSYNYEGGNCDYIITYGDRSVKEPEYAEAAEQMPETEPGTEATEAPTEGEQEAPKSNVGLIAGIAAVVAVVAAAVVILLVSKKKKTAK